MRLLQKFYRYKLAFYEWKFEELSRASTVNYNALFSLQKKILAMVLKLPKSMNVHINVESELYTYDRLEWLSWVANDPPIPDTELVRRRSLAKMLLKWERVKGEYSGFKVYDDLLTRILPASIQEGTLVGRLVVFDLQTIIDGLKLTIKN